MNTSREIAEQMRVAALRQYEILDTERDQVFDDLAIEIRDRIEIAQRESEHFANAIIDACGSTIAILDQSGTIVRVNRRWRDFCQENGGNDEATCVGVNYLDLCNTCAARGDDEAAEFAAGLSSVMSGAAQEFSAKYSCHSPSEKRWFMTTVNRFSAAGAHYFVVAHNCITGQVLAEQEVQQSFNELQIALRAGHLVMWYVNHVTGKQFWSGDCLSVLGCTEAEFSRTFDEFLGRVHPDDHPVIETFLTDRQETFKHEIRFIWPDGSTHWIESTGHKTFNSEGTLVEVVGASAEITARKESEDAFRLRVQTALKESESRLSTVMNGAPVCLLALNKSLVFTFAAGQGLSSFTQSPQIVGRRIEDAYSGAQEFIEAARRCLAGETLTTILNVDKTVIAARMSPTLDDNGMPTGVICVTTDITERRQAELALSEAQKMEAIGRLAAGIAHEINTPMQYIGDNARFLRHAFESLTDIVRSSGCSSMDGVLETEEIDYLLTEIPSAIEETLQGTARVTKIVRALKVFAHQDPEAMAAVDINGGIESTLAVCRSEWKYVADVVTDFDRTIPPLQCFGDSVNQVFLNLIVNAAHAIADAVKAGVRDRGTIRITTKAMPDCVEIRIADTGTGIPQAIRDKVFEMFFTTKEIGRGTGQGLAFAHSVIVGKHGGTIDYVTEEGQGTTFIVRLPIQTAQNVNGLQQAA